LNSENSKAAILQQIGM